MSSFELYLLTRLDAIKVMSLIALAACVIGFGLLLIVTDGDFKDGAYRVLKAFGYTCGLCVAVLVFVPNTKEMAAIYVIPKVANAQRIDAAGRTLDNLMELTEQWTKELLRDSQKQEENKK